MLRLSRGIRQPPDQRRDEVSDRGRHQHTNDAFAKKHSGDEQTYGGALHGAANCTLAAWQKTHEDGKPGGQADEHYRGGLQFVGVDNAQRNAAEKQEQDKPRKSPLAVGNRRVRWLWWSIGRLWLPICRQWVIRLGAHRWLLQKRCRAFRTVSAAHRKQMASDNSSGERKDRFPSTRAIPGSRAPRACGRSRGNKEA